MLQNCSGSYVDINLILMDKYIPPYWAPNSFPLPNMKYRYIDNMFRVLEYLLVYINKASRNKDTYFFLMNEHDIGEA